MESHLDKYRQFSGQSSAACRKIQKSGQMAGFSAFIQGRRIFQMRHPLFKRLFTGFHKNKSSFVSRYCTTASYVLFVKPFPEIIMVWIALCVPASSLNVSRL